MTSTLLESAWPWLGGMPLVSYDLLFTTMKERVRRVYASTKLRRNGGANLQGCL